MLSCQECMEQVQRFRERFSLEGFEQWLRQWPEGRPVGWPCPCCSPVARYLFSLEIAFPHVTWGTVFFEAERGEEFEVELPAWAAELEQMFDREVGAGKWPSRALVLELLEQVRGSVGGAGS
ncbi:hypothetical protein KTAU_30610 [Thermogemmatispora aurantia]|nr:hypothetical protein KTAU_30610 [Thermogemmatispora aurantia]